MVILGRLCLLIIIMAVIFVISLFYTQLIIGVKRRKCDNAGCYMLVFLARCYSYFSATCITYIRCNTSADVLSGKRLVGFYIILKLTRQSSQFPHMRTDSPSYGGGDKRYKRFLWTWSLFLCNVSHIPLPGMKVEHPPGLRVGICLRAVKDPLPHVH